MPPTLANGKICYVEIPALDVSRSALFYLPGASAIYQKLIGFLASQ